MEIPIGPEEAMKNVRSQYIYFKIKDGKTYREILEDYVRQGLVDEEEAHLAIIEGTRKWAETVCLNVASGYGHYGASFSGVSFRTELENLVKRGYIDEEEAHLAIIEGKNLRP